MQYSAAVFLRPLEATNHASIAQTQFQKGTKKFQARGSEKLVCYRYDAAQRKRFTTVELIVEEASWLPPEATRGGLRVERQEIDLQRRIKQADGKWNPAVACGKFTMTKLSRWVSTHGW